MAHKSITELKTLAQEYSLKGKRAQAAETYEAIFEQERDNPRWPQKAGEEFRTLGAKAKAVAAFQAAADLYARQGFTLKAITLCKLVLDLDKGNQAAQRMLANFSTASTLVSSPLRASAPPGAAPPVPQPSPVAPPAPAPQPQASSPSPPMAAAPPAETHETIELRRTLATAVPSTESDIDAVEILIDEPASAETVSSPAPPAELAARETLATRLPPVPIFSSLGKSALRALLDRVDVRAWQPGERIIAQGEEGNSLFVLVDGEVLVVREGSPRVELTRLADGSFFGEIALLTSAPRIATVEALRPSQTLEISREVFLQLVRSYPDMLAVVLRYLRERLVRGLVKTHPLFAPFAGSERTLLVRRFSLVEVARDYALAEEGANAKALYILLCGKAESRRGSLVTAQLAPGDLVGVEYLLTGQPSLVSVRTLTKCWALKMREETFREVVMTHAPVLPALTDIVAAQRQRTAAVAAGAAVVQQGIPLY